MKKFQTKIKYITLIPLIMLIFSICQGGEPGGNVVVIESETDFYEYINRETPVLVDFYADWCRPCRIQGPIVESVSEEMSDKLIVLKLDVDAFPRIAAKYQVRNIPTLILYKKGESLWNGIGLKQKEQIQAAVNAHIRN
ncbi:MAG: thioredoxin [Bacteroidales bacterium]